MKVLQAALSILVDITQNKQTFHNALKAYFSKDDNTQNQPSTVTAFVGCSLRHYIVFSNVGDELYPGLSERGKLAIGLALSNALFLKRLEEKETVEFVGTVLGEENVEFDKDGFVKFLNAKKEGEPLISPTLDKMSFPFISQRYNVSEWIAKMWTHNFNKNTAYKIARANTKNPTQHLRVNTLIGDKQWLLNTYKDELVPCEYNDDLLIYTGKEAVRKKKYIISNRAYQINSGLKELLDKLLIDTFKPIVVYSGYYNLIPLELGVKYNNVLKIENLTTPNKDMYLFKNNLARYQIKNVRTSECEFNQLITAVSNKVAMFIIMPENSNFERLRIDPDYFLNFNRDSLDELINKQSTLINEAADFIEDNGYLVYTVPTINKKEAQNIVSKFLANHNEFKLIDEVQHFPFDSTNSTLYYAIMQKGKQD